MLIGLRTILFSCNFGPKFLSVLVVLVLLVVVVLVSSVVVILVLSVVVVLEPLDFDLDFDLPCCPPTCRMLLGFSPSRGHALKVVESRDLTAILERGNKSA